MNSQLLIQQAATHGRLMFRLAHRILRDVSAAEDACQQTMLKALTRGSQIDDPHKLRGWLARTVVNESLLLARRRKAETRVLARQAAATNFLVVSEPDDGPLREAIVQGLKTLEPETRIVVVLRVMDGMAGNDVKDLLECSAAEVSRRLHSGLEQLRTVLAEWKDG